MSVIALDLIPQTWSHKKIVAMVCNSLNRSHFQILSWGPSKNGMSHHKTVYFEISKFLKPKVTIAKLMKLKEGPFHGFIPTTVPNNPKMKCRFLDRKQKSALGIAVSSPKSYNLTLRSLLYELQIKYNGLYNLSAKCEHKLMENITRVIHKRMAAIYDKELDDCDTALHFGIMYRNYYSQGDDFTMIKECLARVEEEVGLPRTELEESDLIQHEWPHNDIGELKVACNLFANLITKETKQHISSLDTVCSSDDGTEEISRKKIRTELQNVQPYLTHIMHQVIQNNFHADVVPTSNQKIVLIGEPCLPKESKLDNFLSRFNASDKEVSTTNFNIMEFVVPKNKCAEVLSMDSTVCAGAKLLIRPADTSPLYKIPESILNDINTYLDGKGIKA